MVILLCFNLVSLKIVLCGFSKYIFVLMWDHACIKLTGSNFFIFIFLTARFMISPLALTSLSMIF